MIHLALWLVALYVVWYAARCAFYGLMIVVYDVQHRKTPPESSRKGGRGVA